MSQRHRKSRKRNFWSIFYRSDALGSRITGSRSFSVGSGDVTPRKSLKDRWKRFKKRFNAARKAELGDSRNARQEGFSLKSFQRMLSANSFENKTSDSRRNKNARRNKYLVFFKSHIISFLLTMPCIIIFPWIFFLVLTFGPSNSNITSSYTNLLETALSEKNSRVAELLVKKQSSVVSASNEALLVDYARFHSVAGHPLIADLIYNTLVSNPSSLQGEPALHIAKKYLHDLNQSAEMKLILERMLLRAMADKTVEPAVRLELGNFYRENGRLNDAARILNPLRKNESGAIELAIVRTELKEWDEIEIMLAPFLTIWQQRLQNPAPTIEFETALAGLAMMKDEQRVIETLKNARQTIPSAKRNELTELALKCWIDRLLREGPRAYAEILTIINTFEPELSCSTVWFRPLMQISLSDSPLNKDAVSLINNLILKENCNADYLLNVLREFKTSGDLKQAEKLADLMIEKYPKETKSILKSAIEFDQIEPKNPGKAIEILDRLIQMQPDLSAAREARAAIRINNNLFPEAISDLLATSQINQLYPEFHLRIAGLYRKIKDETNALIHEELAAELTLPASPKPSN